MARLIPLAVASLLLCTSAASRADSVTLTAACSNGTSGPGDGYYPACIMGGPLPTSTPANIGLVDKGNDVLAHFHATVDFRSDAWYFEQPPAWPNPLERSGFLDITILAPGWQRSVSLPFTLTFRLNSVSPYVYGTGGGGQYRADPVDVDLWYTIPYADALAAGVFRNYSNIDNYVGGRMDARYTSPYNPIPDCRTSVASLTDMPCFDYWSQPVWSDAVSLTLYNEPIPEPSTYALALLGLGLLGLAAHRRAS